MSLFLHNNIVISCETHPPLPTVSYCLAKQYKVHFGEEKGETGKYSSELPGSSSLCEIGARSLSGYEPWGQIHQLTFNTELIAVSLSSCWVAAAQWKQTLLVGNPLEINP